MSKTSLIVVGEVYTDIIISGLPRFAQSGQLVNGDQLAFGPGGKSRNIAAMAGRLMPVGSVAMVSKTSKDPYGLWQIPLEALHEAGVGTDFVTVSEFSDTNKLPGVSVILVDKSGHNQIIGAPGISRDLSQADIDAAERLFQEVGANGGYLAIIGNTPMEAAKYAIQKAVSHGVRVLYDPGGADDTHALLPLIDENMFILKPNEHEAEELTGVKVVDFQTAKTAAGKLRERGVKHVLITAGAQGAYLFSGDVEEHIAAPNLDLGDAHDETGCGDQVMAALCASLSEGEDLRSAVTKAILAGTLQFHRLGIQPVGPDDMERAAAPLAIDRA